MRGLARSPGGGTTVLQKSFRKSSNPTFLSFVLRYNKTAVRQRRPAHLHLTNICSNFQGLFCIFFQIKSAGQGITNYTDCIIYIFPASSVFDVKHAFSAHFYSFNFYVSVWQIARNEMLPSCNGALKPLLHFNFTFCFFLFF